MVNRFAVCATILFAVTMPLQGICRPGNVHHKLNQAVLQNIQKTLVNSGKELWRLEAPQVAAREAANLDPGCVACKSAPDGAAVQFVRGDERMRVFQYKASDGRRLELTLQKPEWLLPYAGVYKTEMWVVTGVKTTCGK
jgi:hypothetical protein